MGEIVARMRALGESLKLAPEKIVDMFQSSEHLDGSRIAALSLLRNDPDRRHLPIILKALTEPRSPFEQYQALRALDDLSPRLGAEDGIACGRR